MLIIVENLPCPFDRRVWQEARTLTAAGYVRLDHLPEGQGIREGLRGDRRHRDLPASAAVRGERRARLPRRVHAGRLLAEFVLSLRVLFERGFDAIHACNPPDTIFLIGGFYKLFGKKFLFDHHDINPELYEAKFSRRDVFYRLMLALERWTFRTADVCVATNESYRRIAIERGGRRPSGSSSCAAARICAA